MSVSQKMRFEVFKRDSFTCQYCGRSAPDVLLEADHVEPESKGGKGTMLNLITACFDCNRGKSATPLSDQSVLEKQKRQLAELQGKREQLDMMFKWQSALMQIDQDAVDKVCAIWLELVPDYRVAPKGMRTIGKLIKKFGVSDVIQAMRTVLEQYELNTVDQINFAFTKIAGVCRVSRLDPKERELFYIRGILRNRTGIVDWRVMADLRAMVAIGASIEGLTDLAKRVNNWSEWRREIERFLGGNHASS